MKLDTQYQKLYDDNVVERDIIASCGSVISKNNHAMNKMVSERANGMHANFFEHDSPLEIKIANAFDLAVMTELAKRQPVEFVAKYLKQYKPVFFRQSTSRWFGEQQKHDDKKIQDVFNNGVGTRAIMDSARREKQQGSMVIYPTAPGRLQTVARGIYISAGENHESDYFGNDSDYNAEIKLWLKGYDFTRLKYHTNYYDKNKPDYTTHAVDIRKLLVDYHNTKKGWEK